MAFSRDALPLFRADLFALGAGPGRRVKPAATIIGTPGIGGAAILLNVLAAFPAAAQSAPGAFQPDASAAVSADDDTIVIEGRRKSERYRIPPELRTLPKERDMRAQSFDPRLACAAVGPRGCGPPLMRIFTITGDGKASIGSPKDE